MGKIIHITEGALMRLIKGQMKPLQETDFKGKGKKNRQREENKAAKVGSEIPCANCGNPYRKKSYQQVFCGPQCKERYWNEKGDRHKDPNYYDKYNRKNGRFLPMPKNMEKWMLNKQLDRLDREEYLEDDDVLNDLRDEDFGYYPGEHDADDHNPFH